MTHSCCPLKVELIVNPSDEVIPRLRSDYGLERLDFVFMDHWKKSYCPDLQVTIINHFKGHTFIHKIPCFWVGLRKPI